MEFTWPAFLLEVLVWMLPLLVVFFFSERMLTQFLRHRATLALQNRQHEVHKALLSTKTQAIERLVLLVERIRPEGLVNRLSSGASSSAALQLSMLSQIRSEVEHNLAQQVFVSQQGWQAVLKARDEVIGLVHQAAASTPPEETAIQFGRNLFQLQQDQVNNACDQAIQLLRSELHALQRN